MDSVDCVVIGAGVVGLAVARALAQQGYETLIVEREDAFGAGVSSRNSEVIHAGIYYPAGSLKAQLCVRGRELLYAYCIARGVPHRRCEKLIVATAEAQAADLLNLQRGASANGVEDLKLLTSAQARQLEPALSCTAALWSPSTGIVDTHALMLALLADAENHGASLALLSPVNALRPAADGIDLYLEGSDSASLRARWIINATGLNAPALAAQVEGFPAARIPRAHYAKGSYFTLARRAPFKRLIYPVPEPGGLGVHLTLDLAGQARFGPDVEWIDRPDYRVEPARAGRFYAAIRRYWPELREGELQPAYAGVRPKISGPGEPAADFRIEGPQTHGFAGLIHLYGIESPGLTAGLAIAERVAALVAEH